MLFTADGAKVILADVHQDNIKVAAKHSKSNNGQAH